MYLNMKSSTMMDNGKETMNENINNKQDRFVFYLNQQNSIRPKQLKKLDIPTLIRGNKMLELNELLQDLAQEDFEENEAFDLEKDEYKLIKSYQVLLQYMLFSVNKLSKKHQKLQEVTLKQIAYNKEARDVIQKQRKKIKEQEDAVQELTINCQNMEYLIKQLNIDDKIKQLGIKHLDEIQEERKAEFEQMLKKSGFDDEKFFHQNMGTNDEFQKMDENEEFQEMDNDEENQI